MHNYSGVWQSTLSYGKTGRFTNWFLTLQHTYAHTYRGRRRSRDFTCPIRWPCKYYVWGGQPVEPRLQSQEYEFACGELHTELSFDGASLRPVPALL
jgi:hypothetical protein